MNAENFAEIIKDPSRLYQISYQELKTLVLQYPYCSNLHYLLLIKSHMEQHRDFERVLERAAAGSVDRRHLYHQIKALQPDELLAENFELGDEFLELRDLSVLDDPPLEPLTVPDSLLNDEEQADNLVTENAPGFPLPPSPDQGKDGTAFSEPIELDLTPPMAETPLPTAPDDRPNTEVSSASGTIAFHPDETAILNISTWVAIAADLTERRPAPLPATEQPVQPMSGDTSPLPVAESPATPLPVTPPPPLPKGSFSSWKNRRRPAPPLPSLTPPSPPKKKKQKNAIVAFAERSLKENENVASETLAELLATQERYDKAIQMYERLSLIFPEKSSFFAGKIEQLKKRL